MLKKTILCTLLASGLLTGFSVSGADGVDDGFSIKSLESHPDAVKVAPGVYEIAVDDSTIRTYSFGLEGMRHDLDWMREQIVLEKAAGREASDLEETYKSLSNAYATEQYPVRPLTQVGDSGTLCEWVGYDLEVIVNSGPYAIANAEFDILFLPGPVPPFYPESVRLYTSASVVPAGGSGSSDTDDTGDITQLPIGTSHSITSYATGPGPNLDDYAYAAASVYVQGENCPNPLYKSVRERFIQWY